MNSISQKISKENKLKLQHYKQFSSNHNWNCLLIPLKYVENQEQLGQVQLRLEKTACKFV
jgi:hypothetical protein